MKYEDILVKWSDAKGDTFEDLLVLLESYQIIYAYNSGKIENDNITYHDTREIFDKDGVVSYTGDLRTLYEMQNSKDAWKYLLEALKQSLPLDEELLKRFQKLLQRAREQTGLCSVILVDEYDKPLLDVIDELPQPTSSDGVSMLPLFMRQSLSGSLTRS